MKIFNCTTTNGGGGVQNAVNFIKNIYLTNKESEWFLFLSHSVFEEVKSIENISNFKVFQSPARSLTARSEILKFQKELNANIVYTSAGPAYVNFTCEHIMGCSNPFILNIGNSNKINLSSPLKSAIRYLNTCYQNFNIKKADYWVFQTEYTKRLFTKKNIDENKCFVVHNAVSNSFREYSEKVLVDDEKINISHNKTIKI
ncbi:hypothetical protein, partial [Vibrio breoganii]|uniref:hypothetical protein n=1 Tax=Vibrio breoganii TaxID=553239 RepID=UPI0018E4C1F6